MFPVETRYLEHPTASHLDSAVTQLIRRSLAQDKGSLLVFLPGMGEIRRVERTLLDADLGPGVTVAPLHGNLPKPAQDMAIQPATPGARKVVLATSIAETSLTIEGVRIVIDAGLLRIPRFDPRSGLTRLETIRVTQDSADQRRGRAGRLEPGICYRLWTAQEHRSLAPRRPAEILEADLAPLVLDLAVWGTSNPLDLSWLNPPPSGTISRAKELLRSLGALDHTDHITAHGRQMAELPLHPRLSHMLIKADPLDLWNLACEIAALLSERDLLRGPPGWQHADLRLRLDILHGQWGDAAGATVDQGSCKRVKQTAELWRQQRSRFADSSESKGHAPVEATGRLLAFAYPDRIAQRQTGHEARYLMANGRGALFAKPDPIATEPYLVIAELEGGTQWAKIRLAAPISLTDIEALYGDEITETDSVVWDEQTQAVRASRQRRLGALLLSEQPLSKPDPSLIREILLQGVRLAGLETLAWTPELRQWRARVQFLRRVTGNESDWPDLSDTALLHRLPEWVGPYLDGMTTLGRVQQMDLTPPFHALITWEQHRALDRLAPTYLTVPSGSKIRIEYDTPDLPVLAVRLQEMFGCKETPRLVEGKVPVIVHLLSPAKRPVQVTKDLASFWANAYQDVRKELRGRYPKHHWPEDPLSAPPTAKSKRPKR